ncbi:DeoR/GlpR transcriptional regulator [Lactobacillus sp. CC-MHH1034]|uniref:DeoR/GlpR family DNA-binding transcription regulator n=1 Tax=Agrilactobacillus fermenti TaxID=2586909 RepID=UPI001E5D0428|nr:DeoR/GlpR family DNA-binding transcription regulator [Agrilactobacillus fermenti]MCD2255240.1 DeoR/GlpR transcriptional regulator [Agrilactobacillus fermenti]
MLTEERQHYILKCLRTKEIVKLQDLVAHTKASESTVRRDLQELEDAGRLVRIHGGAKRLNNLMDEPSQTSKANTNVAEKQQIAEYAATKIHQGDVIFMDAGTTVQALIPFLTPAQHVTIVTTGVDTAALLAEKQLHIYLIGGQIKNLTKAVIGAKAIAELNDYRFDLAFIGTNGIDEQNGYSTPDPEEGALKRIVLKRSAERYILAEANKFGRVSFDRFGNLSDAEIITSTMPEKFQHLKTYTSIEEVVHF